MCFLRTWLRISVPVETRQSYSCLQTQISFNYSTSSRHLAQDKTARMFKKAVSDHSTVSAKPVQPSISRANGAIQTKSTAQPAPLTGVKRKIEMTGSKESSLGSLHSAVYFDENDFDDDDDLDFGEPDPFVPPAKVPSNPSTQASARYSNSNEAPAWDNIPPIKQSPMYGKNESEIKYPDLPSVPDEDVAPSSSMQFPWSSSPPSHLLPPQPPPSQSSTKRRTLPWLKEKDAEGPKISSKSSYTSARSKQNLPWNKSANVIREEQKELRRQYKKSQEWDANAKLHQPRTRIASLFLSDEQRAVLEAVVDRGKSIFFTGSAGTGKSVLMREIIKKLRDKYRKEPDRVAVTASTGLAACNVEGVTLHSFAGIGLGKDEVPELVKKIKKNQKARTRWLRTKVLVVDEVSMVDGDLFDKLEEIARRIRNNGRPFGGIQLVVTGDFFQLPPVPEGGREAKFAFSAATWNTSIQHTILLTHVFRQKDPEFAEMLNAIRLGKITPATAEAFKRLSRPLDFHDSLEATELFPTRSEVEHANSARMGKLSGETMTFHATDSGSIQDVKFRDRLLANCMAPPVIHLKKGAQVMLIKNMEDTLVNGSIGRVVAFMDEVTFDFYRDNEDDFADSGVNDDEKTSRVRKKLKPLAHKDGGITISKKWPLVCFVQPDGTERHLLCQPESWKIELPNGEIQAQRQQVPLILAWALSIHKAQGQTLQRVKVDLGRVFEKGQAYVALSRATTQAGLQVTRFEPSRVMVHPKVVDFYSNLVSISQVMKSNTGSRKPQTGKDLKKYGEDFEDDLDDEDLQHIYFP